MTTDSEKLDKLTNLIGATRKDTTGKSQETLAIYKPGDLRLTSSVPYGIPTQLAELDLILSKPGYPAGRVIELYGFEASGKTTLGYHAIAQAQAMGGSGLVIDTERTFDTKRARQIGIDTDSIRIAEADTVEEVFAYMEKILDGLEVVGYDKPYVILVDSITGVATEDDSDKDFKAPVRIGMEAATIRRGLKRVNPKIAKQKALALFVNHNVATIAKTAYARQRQSAGGHALKFYSSLRVEVTNIGKLEDPNTKVRIGQKIKVLVEKLKGAPLLETTFDTELLNTTGFDKIGSLLQGFISIGIVEHAPKSRSYVFAPTKQEFPLIEWPNIIGEQGGFIKMYQFFIDCAKANGYMTNWSPSDEQER